MTLKPAFIGPLFAAAMALPALAEPVVEIGPDGLHIQPWFQETAGDVRLDLMAAAAEQKDMIILFEQEGCVYCIRLHNENFTKPEIVDLITSSFLVFQMDMVGADAIIGFDGEKVTEAQLARKWGVTTTPTTIVLLSQNPSAGSLKEAEVFRLPGYLKSFEYLSVIDYFASGAFETQALGPFMRTKAVEFTERGINPKSW